MIYPKYWTTILWCYTVCAEILFFPIQLLRLFKRAKRCTPVANKILLLSATELASRIRKKDLTSREVIEQYIARVKEVNPIINAIIQDRFDEAIKDAEKVDEFIANTKLREDEIQEKYPLLGVPITIKASIAVKGMDHSAGRPDHQVKAKEDATTVKRARDAGAIPLLVSNVPELCLNWETKNKLIGTTNNPYDSRRTPGGSSGGEASLIGSGASVIGIGSDVGGSLRLPAHYCGIWGHKPSPSSVSVAGHYPGCSNVKDWNQVFILGPMSRYAKDLKLLLQVMMEPEAKDVLNLDKEVDVKQLRVYYITDIESPLANRINQNVSQAVQKVIDYFDIDCNINCAKISIPSMKYATELSYLRLLNIDDVENLFEEHGKGAYAELFKYLTRNSDHEFTSICYGIARKHFQHFPVKLMNKTHRHLDQLRNSFMKILKDDGILIMPSSPSEATYHGDVYRKLFNGGYLSIFNALGFPVTNCPILKTKTGLPIGIQVIAGPNMDRLTLAVAEKLENVFGGWKL